MSAMLSPDELLGRVAAPKKPARVVRSPLQPTKTPKLLMEDSRVNRVRSLVILGLPMKEVRRIENLSKSALGHIVRGLTYRSVKGPSDDEIMAAARFLARHRIIKRASR